MIGVGHAKYAKPSEGPFKCGNCHYFTSPDECGQTVVVQDAHAGDLPQLPNKKAKVNHDGCCNMFEPRSRK